MAFTRFHDDPARIKKQLEETTFTGRYMLDTPGPGVGLPYFADPQMRLQKWGANLSKAPVNIESDLIGLSRKLTRDLPSQNDHVAHAAAYNVAAYPLAKPTIDESRATHPAWMYRDLEHSRWETPIHNPQANLELPFAWDVHTRILEKDNHRPTTPSPISSSQNDFEYFLVGRTPYVSAHK